MKEIALSGGGFLGLKRHFSRVEGIERIQAGYINGKVNALSYLDLLKKENCFTEAVILHYDEEIVPLQSLVKLYAGSIDPSIQSERYVIYYVDKSDLHILEPQLKVIKHSDHLNIPIAVEPVQNFYPTQKYKRRVLLSDPYLYN